MKFAPLLAWAGIVASMWVVFASIAPERVAQVRLRLLVWIVAGTRRGRALWRGRRGLWKARRRTPGHG